MADLTPEPRQGAARRCSKASAANPPIERRDAKLVSRNPQDHRKRAPPRRAKVEDRSLGGWACQYSFTSLGL
jgi:hypothetical protein